MKQTAVEWLVSNMPNIGEYIPLGVTLEFQAKIEQAKAMEKEQIIDDFNEGFTEGCRYTTGFEQTLWQDEDDYYNKTYKQQ